MTDHYLLMTATPHKGDPENFCRFLALLDRDVYGNVKSLEEAMRRQEAPFYLRRTKEALVTFPDPETGEVHKLFTKREVQTAAFELDGEEFDFYDALTRYVEDQSIRAAAGRLGARAGRRLHDGHAPAADGLQHLRRPAQPGTDEGAAREDPGRPGGVPPGADRAAHARRLRRPDRTKSSRDARTSWRTRSCSVDPAVLREEIAELGEPDRPGASSSKSARVEIEAHQAEGGPDRARHLRRPEDEAAALHRAQGHARLPGRRRQGRPAPGQAPRVGPHRSRRFTAA